MHVTVKDSMSDNTVSVITGARRYAFNLEGEKSLFTGCYTSTDRHSFVTGSRTAGPNVFHDCHATNCESDVSRSTIRLADVHRPLISILYLMVAMLMSFVI